MAGRGKMLSIDFSAFSDYAERLDQLGADLQQVIGDAMDQAAETVQWDVTDAMATVNLPAGGKYSQGEIGLGFDKTKPGAGGFLITGTPKMRPNYALEDIFSRKKYLKTLMNQISDELQDAIDERIGG